jgi:hypothetical protein
VRRGWFAAAIMLAACGHGPAPRMPDPTDPPDQIEKTVQLNAPGEPVEGGGVYAAVRVARLNAEQCRDHLQVVLNAVLDFQQQGVFLAQLSLELFTLRLSVRTNLDQRSEPESGRSVIIHDNV